MTKAEQRKAAGKFIYRWKDKGNEDEDGRSYWIELLHGVLGMDHVTERVNFEKKVYVDGNKKRIDELFLNELTDELHQIQQISVVKTKRQRLDDFQTKLASLRFLEINTQRLIQFNGVTAA